MKTNNINNTPWIATHPGTILTYELEERHISPKDFAASIGIELSELEMILKGKCPVNNTMAQNIENVLGIPSTSLITLQKLYEEDKLQQKLSKVKYQ